MWNIQFTWESLTVLDNYIENYQEYFLSRFSNTGIWNEDTIRENYENEAIQVYNEIYDHIIEVMKRDLIGYEPSGWKISTTATFLWKRIIFLEYEEDLEAQTRYIQILKIIYR